MTPRFFTLWAVNAALDATEAHRQLDAFVAAGFDGVVFHPRRYPDEPAYLGDAYLAALSEVIEYSASIGLAFWIYDENGWPSGTVGGRLLEEHPADAQRWLELDTAGEIVVRRGTGIDYLSRAAVGHFLELTYERYRHGLTAAAFEHVESFFDDEPEFGLGHAFDSVPATGALPWTDDLPGLFEERYGRPLLPLVPSLFSAGDDSATARVQFWELVTDLFADTFLGSIDRWCRSHGKTFTVHLKGEENPLFQAPLIGSLGQGLRRVGLPGVDALERNPGNDFYPRQVSSVARQFGTGRSMVEAFGGAGWGATPADLERYLLWLGRHGLTDFVLHLSQYRLDSAALSDWPPSQPLHVTWCEAYPELLARVRAELTSSPRPAADTLVVVPQRAVTALVLPAELAATNIHNASVYPDSPAARVNDEFLDLVARLHAAGVEYDFADERTIETDGVVRGSELWVGRASYAHVILPSSARLDPGLREELRRLLLEGLSPKPVALRERGPDPAPLSIAVDWRVAGVVRNELPLDVVPDEDGWFTAHIALVPGFVADEVRLDFADDVRLLEVDGRPLEPGEPTSLAGSAVVRFALCDDTGVLPRAWVRGSFAVVSTTALRPGFDDRQVATDGPFRLAPLPASLDRDLVASGLPFAGEPLTVTAEFELFRPGSGLGLDGVVADAVHATLDGHDLGWAWGDVVEFAGRIDPGHHVVTIRVVPNGFNRFGPHHYYRGDHSVVSPAQVAGVKNFADPVDAPDRTHVAAWSFRRWELPSHVTVGPPTPV